MTWPIFVVSRNKNKNKIQCDRVVAAKVLRPGIEPGTSAVLRPRHNQLDHPSSMIGQTVLHIIYAIHITNKLCHFSYHHYEHLSLTYIRAYSEHHLQIYLILGILHDWKISIYNKSLIPYNCKILRVLTLIACMEPTNIIIL